MEDVRFEDAPLSDRAAIINYTESHGGATVLRVGDKIGSDAQRAFIEHKKANDYADPPHDFVWIEAPSLGRESSAADVDGAGSETRSGHHESVGERQGRQPAPVRLWRWLTRRKATPSAPDPLWLDDDDPLARVLNAAWESNEPVFWTEGMPLPERAENPRKVERGDD